ncbi:acyl-CoA synthetase [Emcibacter nanhaiensis]|uniref:3-methylmercaptopropionyl-CoA ligase n=1 Tax=Emcibacter nanhaiensis TaxID=1505037 RepID=A0A501PBS4_9PROT|nr:acyl-CoA synthetase [Emcibacter nanhaiensis]TPD57859.1 long-chain-fatty-acid--CoA ligase [Emcibacter nanhaiensis]
MTGDQDLQATINQTRSQQLGDLLRRSARRLPDKTALVYGDQRDTFAELDELVNRTANALREKGIGKGERVALLSHNNRSFVILRFALARLGAVMTPINYMLHATEVAYILSDAGVSAMIAEDALVELSGKAIAEAGLALKFTAFIPHTGTDVPPGWENVESWFDHPDTDARYVEIDDDDPVQLMYTSGTESRPKGVLLTARALYAQYVSCIVDGNMTAGDVDLHSLPLYHCAQLDCFLSPDLYLGATSILLPGPDPEQILATIEREKVTKLFCPPTIWIALLRHPKFDQVDLSSLCKGYYGASIMPTAIIEELSERLPDLALYNFYGQTELAPVATILGPGDQLRKLGSAGRPALNVETRVVDDGDNPVPPGEVGEIVHRSPQATLGYYNNPEKTAEAFRGGWFHSGDLGRMDEDGYLYVVDRKKDMIKTGGENVASREVEEVIFTHPAVAEVAVFGVPHPTWIEAVTAAVVCKPDANVQIDELLAYCRERLAGYKCPKYIVALEALPKNASGKILKRDLRLSYEAIAGDG